MRREEKGLLGSAALVKKGIEVVKGKELMAGISAMVNIDAVQTRSLWEWPLTLPNNYSLGFGA